jgi:hypothetical protein
MDIVSMELHLKKNNYLKSPIGTISWRRPNNFLHEIDFRGGHLNQDQHFLKMKWIKWSIIWFYDVKLLQGI